MEAKKNSGEPRKVARYLFRGEYGYYCRMGVPVALRSIVGKRELWAPVHAETDAQARRKAHAIIAGFNAKIEAARAQAKIGRPAPHGRPLSPHQLAVAQYDDRMRVDSEFRNADHRYALHGVIDEAYVRGLREIIRGAADNGQIRETLGVVLRYYEVRHIKAAEGTPEWREAARALAVAELESLARTAERDEGDDTGKPSHPLLTEKPQPIEAKADPLAARNLAPDSSKSLGEIVIDYVKERHAAPQTEYKTKLTAKLFEECLGEAKPIYRITRQDVHAFKKMLANLPTNATKRFPGMTATEAVAANNLRASPFPVLDPQTINRKYLSGLCAVFNWCVRGDLLPDNPASGIKVDSLDKRAPPRVPFSPSDLTRIFCADRYDIRKPFNEQQWAELLALFTGMRAGELAQVTLDNIRNRGGCLVIEVAGELKTASSHRLVPVHSTLVKLGFEKRVERLRKSGATHLFPEWYGKATAAHTRRKVNGTNFSNNDFPRFVPRIFNTTILPKAEIKDSRKTFHSFRHSFTTGLELAGVQRSTQHALTGHADGSVHAGYIHAVSIEVMRDAIEKLHFDGFMLAT